QLRAAGGWAAGPGRVGVAAAALGGVVAWAVGAAPELPGLLFVAGLGFVLAPVDVRTHRLPDALVLPAYPVLTVLLVAGALLGGVGVAPLARAAAGGLVAFGVLYVLAVAVPAGFGFGDVKLTGLLGAALGWYGWSAVFAALVYGFVYGGLCAAALLLTRRLSRADRLAFGPFLLAGALTVVCTAG
ncbi:prepilin peptidase, partial [Cryptosporangium minutisporangium]|uniref:prepilin peptidase n=1 Tax=Cryptosporangium minutisporangium TaxID=113569 RepID=UPI0035E7A66F